MEAAVLNAFTQLHEHDNPAYIDALSKLKYFPVSIEEFIYGDDFLRSDTKDPVIDIWPTLVPALKQMNPDIILGEPPVYETVMAGATGVGKTVRGEISNLYQLYVLSAFDWPQTLFNLSKSTFINLVFMSVKPATAITTLYKPFRQKFNDIKFFQKHVSYNKLVDSELRLDQNIIVKPITASMEALIRASNYIWYYR